MISVESHSRQIKLLNDYVQALEKQVTSGKQEIEEVRKNEQSYTNDIKKLTDDVNKSRFENEQLKSSMGKLNQELNRYSALDREYLNLRKHCDQLNGEKNDLMNNIKQITANNQTLYERTMELEGEVKAREELVESEKKKWSDYIEALKKQVT